MTTHDLNLPPVADIMVMAAVCRATIFVILNPGPTVISNQLKRLLSWVMPRLNRLHRSHPAIDLRLQVVDKDVDLEHENVSLGIRRGRGNWRLRIRPC